MMNDGRPAAQFRHKQAAAVRVRQWMVVLQTGLSHQYPSESRRGVQAGHRCTPFDIPVNCPFEVSCSYPEHRFTFIEDALH
jgi:hypothetical protein